MSEEGDEGRPAPFDYELEGVLPPPSEENLPVETRADRVWEFATDVLALVIRFVFLICVCVLVIGMTLIGFMFLTRVVTEAIANRS